MKSLCFPCHHSDQYMLVNDSGHHLALPHRQCSQRRNQHISILRNTVTVISYTKWPRVSISTTIPRDVSSSLKEEEYKALREVMSRRIIHRREGGNYGFAVQNYFPIQESWVKPYLLEEQLGIAISSAVAAPA